jgi:predicted alpha/beta superfamily hydrolase
MKRTAIAVLSTAAISAAVTYSVSRYLFERPELGSSVDQGTLYSEVLDEKREFLVHLPESYSSDPERRYPVLYVLDGTSQDIHTAESAALMARIGVVPEILVVGIPNVNGEGRQRDYTPPGMRQDIDENESPDGAGDRFLLFLETELIPRVEGEYRTNGLRMLAGNSRGALLVVYSLIEKPSLFEARFAHSPALWRDGDTILERLERFLTEPREVQGFLYLSLGDEENEKMTSSFRRAVTILETHAPPSLTWRADWTRGADHGNNAERATPVGLQAFFAGGRQ